MLNPFPIQFLAPLAYFLLRVALGFLIIRLGKRLWGVEPRTSLTTVLASVEILVGSMFILGFYTQIAALVTLILAVPALVRPSTSLRAFTTSRPTIFLMSVIALSLVVTGAGAFAFDLPI